MITANLTVVQPGRVSWRKLVGLMLWLLLGLFVLPEGRTLLAQNCEIKFEPLGMQQGLSQSTVYCILQDRQGFMWFSTQEGLNKYDGYRFIVYKQNVFDSTSLSLNLVGPAIYEDHTGTLWVGTWGGGLNRFDREKEQFTRFVHDPKNPYSLSTNGVTAICEDRSGTLWIGTDNGLNKFDREREQFIHFIHDSKNPRSLNGNSVVTIHEDHTGALWIGTDGGGLNKFNSETEQFSRFVHDSKNPHSLSTDDVTAICEDRSGTLWIGTDNGLNKFDREREQFIHFIHDSKNPHSLNDNYVATIYEDHTGTLWIGTKQGLNQFDRRKGQFTRIFNDPKNSQSLSDNRIWSIYEDRSGILWIGTMFDGLNKFDRKKEKFIRFCNDTNNPHSLGHNVVNALYEDHTGTLWIGTVGGGLSQLRPDDRDKKNFTHFVRDMKNSHSLSNNNVGIIYEDHSGMLWVGTRGAGLINLIARKSHLPILSTTRTIPIVLVTTISGQFMKILLHRIRSGLERRVAA